MPLRGKERVQRNLRDRADKLVRAVSLEAHGRLIRRTPVRTGRARGNWNVGIDKIERDVDENAQDKSGRAALARGQATILVDVEAGDRVFLTNALDYVRYLNQGSSKQAPEGMTAITVAEMRPLISRALATLAVGP